MSIYFAILLASPAAFGFGPGAVPFRHQCRSSVCTSRMTPPKLSELPQGISPYEKSDVDVPAILRNAAKKAIDAAIADDVLRLEIEFPALIGEKSNFDDFDNVQELEKNKDWSVQLAPTFQGDPKGTWLIFPDLKECELAKAEWPGARYQAATFTDISSATSHLGGEGSYVAPWGSNLVGGLSNVLGGKDGDAGLLGDRAALDDLGVPPSVALVVQPGNGGPVEDWINVEKVADGSPGTAVVVINGALDKVRGYYYPAVFFPQLAQTVDRFYKKFESVLYLKSISDKGAYGWLYRVYPEPWQVILQTPVEGPRGMVVEDTIVQVTDDRPEYLDALAALLKAKNSAGQ